MWAIVDGHCDSIEDYVENRRPLNLACGKGQLDLPKLRQAGVAVQFFASFIDPAYQSSRAVLRGLQLVEGCRRLINDNPDYLRLLKAGRDLQQAREKHQTAALLSIEGGSALGGELFMLGVFYHLGVRALGLTWNHANELAGGVLEPRGLTSFGKEVVKDMNRRGMIVDVSHLCDQSFWDVLECTTQPVIASHSCCRSLCNHPRNLNDTQITALAAAGGVIGINFYTQFLKGETADLADVVEHIQHVCDLVGPEHVGLGSDFDGCETVPKGLEDASKLPNLAVALLNRGYKEADVEKIMGGNFLRIIDQVLSA